MNDSGHELFILEDVDSIIDKVNFLPLEGKSILVTGATGLLGTHIATILSRLNDTGMVDLDLTFQVQRKPPAWWIEQTGCGREQWIYANLANPNDCARLPHADVVICAHSYAQPLKFIAEPLIALRGASYGLLSLLECCNVGGRFLYISSSEVYCDSPAQPPYKENDTGVISPYHPRACYIMGKLFGEAMTYLYRNRGISTVAVRPGITYGPGFKRDDQRSWASFIQRAVDTRAIKLMDAGEVRRTVCYTADGMVKLFRVLLNGTQPVYNLAGGHTLSIAEMARIVAAFAQAEVIIPEVNKGVAGTPENLALCNDLYETEFGRTDFIMPADGFARAVAWYRGTYGG